MTDSDDGIVREEPELEAEAEPTHVSDGYVLVMDEVAAKPLRLMDHVEGAGPEFFIQAQEPSPEGQARIRNVGSKISMTGFGVQTGGNRQQRRAMGKQKQRGAAEEPKATVDVFPEAAFMQKCLEQITDYCLPTRTTRTDGTQEDGQRRYDRSHGGDNEYNQTTYRSLLKPAVTEFRWLVEGYLDYVAGLDTPAQEDFAALGNAR